MALDIDDSKCSGLRSGDSGRNWIEGMDLPVARSGSDPRKAFARMLEPLETPAVAEVDQR